MVQKSGKELMMNLVTKIKETQKDKASISTSFGMWKSPETNKIKKLQNKLVSDNDSD